jgi:hypothetical protein
MPKTPPTQKKRKINLKEVKSHPMMKISRVIALLLVKAIQPSFFHL